MKSYHAIYILFILVASSCSQPTFQSFYNAEKAEARLAMAFPKYFAMIAIPKDAKEEVKYFTKGMGKIRLLYFGEHNYSKKLDFTHFADLQGYTPYIVVKEDQTNINVYTKEDDEFIREIVLDLESDNEAFIVALIGKMDKRTFAEALRRANEEARIGN